MKYLNALIFVSLFSNSAFLQEKQFIEEGNRLFNDSNFQGAIEYYTKAIVQNSDPEVFYLMGLTYFNLQRVMDAISDYTMAIKLKPTYVEAYYNRGIAYEFLKKPTQCIEDFTKAIEFNSSNIEAYYHRGLAYSSLKKYEESIDDFSKAIDLEPQRYISYFFRGGVVYSEIKNFDKAISDYSRAIKLNPEYATGYRMRGLALAKIGKFNEALDDFSNSLQIDPNNADAFFNRGITYFKLQKNEDAISDYLEACRLDSTYCANSYNNIGYAFFSKGDFSNAEINFKKCIEVDDNKFDAMIGLSMVNFNLREFEDAKMWMGKAMEKQPKLKEGEKGINKIIKDDYSY